MGIIEILKSPFKGNFINNKLKMKESIIINFILACVFAIILLIGTKTLANDLSNGLIDGYLNLYDSLGVKSVVNVMFIKAFILILINYVAIIFVFSAIIYIINKAIFKLQISYEECVSTFTYANIIPIAIMPIGLLFSLLSVSLSLSVIIVIIQTLVLMILTYEGLGKLLIVGKSKLIYSIAITNVVNTMLFVATYYLIIESSFGKLF